MEIAAQPGAVSFGSQTRSARLHRTPAFRPGIPPEQASLGLAAAPASCRSSAPPQFPPRPGLPAPEPWCAAQLAEHRRRPPAVQPLTAAAAASHLSPAGLRRRSEARASLARGASHGTPREAALQGGGAAARSSLQLLFGARLGGVPLAAQQGALHTGSLPKAAARSRCPKLLLQLPAAVVLLCCFDINSVCRRSLHGNQQPACVAHSCMS